MSDENIESGLVGGGNDGGCDSLYIICNGKFITGDLIDDIQGEKDSEIKFEGAN